MSLNKSTSTEVKVGVFVVLGVLITCLVILVAGGEKSFFEGSTSYRITYPQVDGLQVGSTVKIAGYRVGAVDSMKFQENGEIKVTVKVMRKYAKLVREDSMAQIGVQGMLGDKYINITVGNSTAPEMKDGAELHAERSKELKDYLSKGDQLIENLNNSISHLESIMGSFRKDGRAENFFKSMSSVSVAMSQATKDLPQASKDVQSAAASMKSVMSKIDRGDGTMGALINDQSLYDDLKALLGGANRNRVLKYFIKKSVEESRDAARDAASEPAQNKN